MSRESRELVRLAKDIRGAIVELKKIFRPDDSLENYNSGQPSLEQNLSEPQDDSVENNIDSNDASDMVPSRNRRIEMLMDRQRALKRDRRNNKPGNITGQRRSEPLSVKINLPQGPTLTDTIFSSLARDGEIFLYSNNRLFILNLEDNINGDGYFLDYKGKKFRIEESENIIKVEQEFLERNRENIKRFRLACLDRLSQQHEELRNKFLMVREAINTEFSVERLISDYIFAIYHKRRIPSAQKYEDVELQEEDFHKNAEVEDISFSGIKKSILERLVEELPSKQNISGLIILDGNVYGFPFVREFTGRKEINYYDAFRIDSIRNFDCKYKERISKEIKERVKENLSSEILKISKGREKMKGLNQQKRKPIRNMDGDIGFDKISGSEYLIYRDLPEFILWKGRNYYLFPPARIGTRILFDGEKVSFNVDGRVETPGYHHPFVFGMGGICYGKVNGRQKEILGIENNEYRVSDLNKRQFAVDVLKVLYLTEAVLTRGYKGKPSPVYGISTFSGEKISKGDAESLKNQGIVIYDNNGATI